MNGKDFDSEVEKRLAQVSAEGHEGKKVVAFQDGDKFGVKVDGKQIEGKFPNADAAIAHAKQMIDQKKLEAASDNAAFDKHQTDPATL